MLIIIIFIIIIYLSDLSARACVFDMLTSSYEYNEICMWSASTERSVPISYKSAEIETLERSAAIIERIFQFQYLSHERHGDIHPKQKLIRSKVNECRVTN